MPRPENALSSVGFNSVTTPKPARGGARNGAGRKPTVTGDDVRSVTLRISAEDEATFRLAGGGILSRGVQLGAAALRRKKS